MGSKSGKACTHNSGKKGYVASLWYDMKILGAAESKNNNQLATG
jgi:hypothetical protein